MVNLRVKPRVTECQVKQKPRQKTIVNRQKPIG